MFPNKISLIGMPSSGKTNIGRALADKLGYDFFDLDSMVEQKENKSLITILEENGAQYFLNIECSFLTELKPDKRVVISTAGSIIYHNEAMNWLKTNSVICFIDTDYKIIESRLLDKPKAVVGLKEKGLKRLWDERLPVYRDWSDFKIKTDSKDIKILVDEIITRLNK